MHFQPILWPGMLPSWPVAQMAAGGRAGRQDLLLLNFQSRR